MNKANAKWSIITRNRKTIEECRKERAEHKRLLDLAIASGLITPLDTFPDQPTEH